MNKPHVVVFDNYLPHEEWLLVNKYAHTHDDDFSHLGAGASPIRFKKTKHSRKPYIEYENGFILSDGDYQSILSGEMPEPHPGSLGNEDDWKVPIHSPVDKNVRSSILKTINQSQAIISSIYGDDVEWEFGPFISKIDKGKSLRLHCDTFQFGLPGLPPTDYSAIYYINDDYDGGENVMPAIGLTFKPNANSMMLVSRSWHEDSVHGINMVTSGTRYMSQGFFSIKKGR